MSTEDTGPARLRLAVLGMAGTTVDDGGLQERAFARAVAECGVEPGSPRFDSMWEYCRDTMGTAKAAVFGHLFRADPALGRRANDCYEQAFEELLDGCGIRPVPGAEEAIGGLRDAGLKICLSTGFTRRTQNMILESLGWMGLADLSLCPSDAGRGRPYPDMILNAVLALDIDDVRAVLVAEDSRSGIRAGVQAGAGVVAGVLTGYHDEAALRAAGATAVVRSLGGLAELPALGRRRAG